MERKQHELEATKQRMSQLQERYDQSTAEFEQRLDLARDKERQLIAVSARTNAPSSAPAAQTK